VTAGAFRRVAAEFIGSAGLVVVVMGSGVAAERLSTDTGLQLLENALVTALGLAVLILVFQPVSGAHFNPVVSAVDAALGGRRWTDVAPYVLAQIAGCIVGAVLANLMFGLAAISWSTTERATWPHLLAEVIATAGLVVVIFALVRTERAAFIAPAVGAYIGAAYFFTSSTSFANPAITVGRMLSDTFAGIAPASVPAFLGARLVGGLVGALAVRLIFPRPVVRSAAATGSGG
jgi:glycerol uptake facilitator-like aquaporin